MNSSASAQQTVVLIGAGGIGAPVAWALCEAGIRRLIFVDDDEVELSNLHRQILFDDDTVGKPKCQAFKAALERRFNDLDLSYIVGRALPSTVAKIVAMADVVIDATDNFPSRFLIADAARLASVPVVHAAAVRFRATVMAVAQRGRPCYRCLFEEIPSGPAPDCITAGVAGPVCGVSGALAADRVLRILSGDDSAFGHIVTYDGLQDRIRQVPVSKRAGCPLCSDVAVIGAIEANRL